MKKWMGILLALALTLGMCPVSVQAAVYQNPREKEPAVMLLTEGDEEAASGDCGDNVTWNLTEDGVLTITGTGDMWDYPVEYPGWYAYMDRIVECVIGEGVTSIGEYAFYDCISMVNLKIPQTVTFIGYGAFYSCESLSGVVIPAGVTEIDSWAFYGCASMTSVEIPASLPYIGFCVFYGCESLTDVHYNGTQEQWDAISIDDGNEDLLNAALHFGSAEPEILFGDTNADGRVNTLDLILLRQYLAGWEVAVDQASADVNGDGKVNSRDLLLLRQYLAGWDVTLGP